MSENRRFDGRKVDQLRELSFEIDYQNSPLSSVLVSFGKTRVLCSVSCEYRVPGWMTAQGVPGGWITSEYSMLPGATGSRNRREVKSGKQSGRTMEIQRLIGRALRGVIDISKMPNVTLLIDCDVIDADGGTRCASICGASLAVKRAFLKLAKSDSNFIADPMANLIAAVSVGIVDGEPVLDLCYEEDSRADVDMNCVLTDDNRLIELQGTAEEAPFDRSQLNQMLDLAEKGVDEILTKMKRYL